MNKTVTSSALGLIETIDAIERETEAIYLNLGKVFRTVKLAVDTNSSEAEAAITSALGFHRGGASAATARRRSEDFIEDSTRFFKNAEATEQTFLDGVEAGIRSLSMLDEIIGRIRSDSEEMEIVSLNAMTVALKSGAAGRAFSVITDELKRLSGRTIKHADDLSQAGFALLERLGALRVTLGSLTAAQSSFFASAMAALENGFTALDREVDQTAHDIRALSEEASSVRIPISAIMQEVQLQDIIRQSLDHVRISLKAAEPSTQCSDEDPVDLDEEQAFLIEITRLSASLLDDVSAQVRASLDRFNAGIAGVNAVMASVEAARSTLLAVRGNAGNGGDYESKATPYITMKEKAVTEAAAISDGVRRLDERFKQMNGILARFKSIVTASRIETARNKALSIVSTTVSGMMELTGRLTEDVAAAGGVTRSFGKTLSAGMTDYLSGAEDNLVSLREKGGELRDEFLRIDESRRRLWAIESDFKPYSDEFSMAIREATKSVVRIETLASELESMRAALASCTGDDENSAARVAASSIHSERLRSIVDRFTIFAHKQTATRLGSIAAQEDGSSAESGEVTLF